MRNTLPGLNMTIEEIDASQRKAYENANPKPDFAMCRPVKPGENAYFPDDQIGVCFLCEGKVYYRPYLAKGITLVCMGCFPRWYKTAKKGAN